MARHSRSCARRTRQLPAMGSQDDATSAAPTFNGRLRLNSENQLAVR
ncbi:hypothetical protein ABZ214_20510 [Streptomyces iakyrus]